MPYPGGRSPDNRMPDNRMPDNRMPDNRMPDNRMPDNRYPQDSRFPDDRIPDPRNSPRGVDPRTVELDALYRLADQYLNEMAEKSGGKLTRADTLFSLPAAFAQIAAELRTQYSLGYYPSNAARDGKYRKLQVGTKRKNVLIRARPGYRAPG
jgi:VWFA-related protein